MISDIKNWWKDYNKLETRIRLRERLVDGTVVYTVYLCEYRVRFHDKNWRGICPFRPKEYSEANSEEKAKELIDNFLNRHSKACQTRDTIIKYP